MSETSILPLKLEFASVTKRGKTIINEASLVISPTGRTIIMGPNGSGKTTLLRLMHGLERPRSGKVVWAAPTTEAVKMQAFVFQHPIMMRRNVRDNLTYPMRLVGISKANARQAAEDWARKINLIDHLDQDAQLLSGGERQKLAIARALIRDPQIMFLDEPTTNLDGQSTKEIEELLLEASKKGTCIVMATHDIGQAKRLATDIVFLNRAEICESGSADMFFSEPKTQPAQAYLRGDIVE